MPPKPHADSPPTAGCWRGETYAGAEVRVADDSLASFRPSPIPARTVFQDQQQPTPLFARPPTTPSCTRADSPPRVGPRRVLPDHALSRTCAPHVRMRWRASATNGGFTPHVSPGVLPRHPGIDVFPATDGSAPLARRGIENREMDRPAHFDSVGVGAATVRLSTSDGGRSDGPRRMG